ncbi:GNAT family N-acetyltransferase [Vibrio sp. SCSIO 43153]|uniref:GNAT family N-acetyltransferase n=1 Tax=Vibrio sp. SCSIO 43153 TaxID=2819098 RepID=UPI002075958B|nr:GNAT family N-acetyltransferase [Vibrio sp. SCSIO 43153]USD48819.1 GNAT family N-acetyltransferase [Vibrio sp. SCSIO 43153]
MIAIKPAKLKDFASLMQLEVHDDQKGFFKPFEQAYQNRSKSEVFYTIFQDSLAVGYLVIDKAFAQYAPFAKRHELKLSYMVIGKQFQQKGVGKATLQKLMVYGYAIDAESNSICATVSCSNKGGITLFESAGFENTQKTIYEPDGKAVIMRHPLS